MKAKKYIKMAAISVFAAVLGFTAVNATMAYMADREAAKNVFTTGKVDITLTEPHYPGNDTDPTADQVGHQETPKDPVVTNVGVNDAVVFLKMTVPVADVVTVNDDGTKNDSAKQELYYFKKTADAASKHQNNFYSSWIELPSKENGTALTGATRTYVFGYQTKIAKNQKTDPLFDKIQMKRVLEGNLSSGTEEQIKIEAYAIQADQIFVGGSAVDTSGTLTADQLTSIYNVYAKQNQ